MGFPSCWGLDSNPSSIKVWRWTHHLHFLRLGFLFYKIWVLMQYYRVPLRIRDVYTIPGSPGGSCISTMEIPLFICSTIELGKVPSEQCSREVPRPSGGRRLDKRPATQGLGSSQGWTCGRREKASQQQVGVTPRHEDRHACGIFKAKD